MALTPPNDQALLREVDDAVRQDMLLTTWRRYGRWIIVAIVAGLALFAAWLWWKSHREERSGESGEKLSEQLKVAATGGTPDMKAVDALTTDSQPGYRAAALLTKAGVLSTEGKTVEAASLYGTIAADSSLGQPYRDVALVRQVALQFDKLKPEEVIARLKPLAQEGNPWFGSAGEMTAIAYMKSGQPKLAAPIFAALAKGKDVPGSIRSRAVQMAGLLGVDAVDLTKPGQFGPQQGAQ